MAASHSGSGAAAPIIRREDLGDLSEYEELQLSPLERERFDGKGRRPTIDRVLGYDVGDGPQ